MKTNGNDISRFLLLCGVFAPVMMMFTIFIVGQITQDYNPISDSISQMGIPDRPYSILLNAGYVVYGMLIGLAARGLSISMGLTTRAKRIALLLSIHAIGTMLLGIFPDSLDLPAKPFSADLIHNIVSAVSLLPLLVSILVFRGIARGEKALKVVGILGLVVIAINLPMPLINYIGAIDPISGLIQRILCGSAFCWLSLTFILLYRKRYRLGSEYRTISYYSTAAVENTETVRSDRVIFHSINLKGRSYPTK